MRAFCPIRHRACSHGPGRAGYRWTKARAACRFEWLERELRESKLPTLLVWGREDEVFDHATFATRFKELLPHAEGPELVTGRHFLQEDSGEEIAGEINHFLDRIEGR